MSLLKFTAQPKNGVVSVGNGYYHVSWETSFTPARIEIGPRISGDVFPLVTLTEGLSRKMGYDLSSDFQNSEGLFIKAYFPGAEYLSRTSQAFTVSPVLGCHFTSYPQGGSVYHASYLPLRWTTDFMPIYVNVMTYNENGSYCQMHTLANGDLTMQMNYSLTWDEAGQGQGTAVIRAYVAENSFIPVTVSVNKVPLVITYDAAGGELHGAQAQPNAEGKIPNLPTASREGYNFVGWYYGSASSPVAVTADTVFYTSQTLIAQWAPLYHELTVINGSPASDSVGTDRNVSITAQEIPGLQFYRWVVVEGDAVIANVYSASTQLRMGLTDATVKATYQYIPVTVTFDAAGGAVSPAAARTGANGKLSSLPTPTREGYTFNYWYRPAIGGGTSVVTTNSIFQQDTTVTASWSGVWHSVTVQDGTANQLSAPTGATVTVIANERANYTFSHWAVVSGGAVFSDTSSAVTTFVMGIEPAVVRAYYTYSGDSMTELYAYVDEPSEGRNLEAPSVTSDAYNVNSYEWYDVDAGEALTLDDVFEAGKTYRLRIYLRISGDEHHIDSSVVGYINGSAEGVTTTYQAYLQAILEKTWTIPSYTVSFDANGGTGSMADQTPSGWCYTLPECGFTPPEDYAFCGWDLGRPSGMGRHHHPGWQRSAAERRGLLQARRDL